MLPKCHPAAPARHTEKATAQTRLHSALPPWPVGRTLPVPFCLPGFLLPFLAFLSWTRCPLAAGLYEAISGHRAWHRAHSSPSCCFAPGGTGAVVSAQAAEVLCSIPPIVRARSHGSVFLAFLGRPCCPPFFLSWQAVLSLLLLLGPAASDRLLPGAHAPTCFMKGTWTFSWTQYSLPW